MNATLVFEGELAVVTLAAPTRAQPVLDLAMIEAGATRLGTSSGVAILRGVATEGSGY